MHFTTQLYDVITLSYIYFLFLTTTFCPLVLDTTQENETVHCIKSGVIHIVIRGSVLVSQLLHFLHTFQNMCCFKVTKLISKYVVHVQQINHIYENLRQTSMCCRCSKEKSIYNFKIEEILFFFLTLLLPMCMT